MYFHFLFLQFLVVFVLGRWFLWLPAVISYNELLQFSSTTSNYNTCCLQVCVCVCVCLGMCVCDLLILQLPLQLASELSSARCRCVAAAFTSQSQLHSSSCLVVAGRSSTGLPYIFLPFHLLAPLFFLLVRRSEEFCQFFQAISS